MGKLGAVRFLFALFPPPTPAVHPLPPPTPVPICPSIRMAIAYGHAPGSSPRAPPPPRPPHPPQRWFLVGTRVGVYPPRDNPGLRRGRVKGPLACCTARLLRPSIRRQMSCISVLTKTGAHALAQTLQYHTNTAVLLTLSECLLFSVYISSQHQIRRAWRGYLITMR